MFFGGGPDGAFGPGAGAWLDDAVALLGSGPKSQSTTPGGEALGAFGG